MEHVETFERDIPIPKVAFFRQKYPFRSMEVGDSKLISFPEDDKEKVTDEMRRKIQLRVSNAIVQSKRRPEHSHKKFTTRTMTTGIRVWRTE